MKHLKKLTALFLAVALVLPFSVTTRTTKAVTLTPYWEAGDGWNHITDLTPDEINALDSVAMTDKEMLDDIIERGHRNDFRNKTYILKFKDSDTYYESREYWGQYLSAKSIDIGITAAISSENYVVDTENAIYHQVTIGMWVDADIQTKEYDESGTLIGKTITNWNEYDDKVRNIERELGLLSENLCDGQKIHLVSQWISENIVYDMSGITKGQTAYEAVLYGTAVCAGYSRLFNRFMYDCGIDSYVLTSQKLNHAWNIVKLHGAYHHIDLQQVCFTNAMDDVYFSSSIPMSVDTDYLSNNDYINNSSGILYYAPYLEMCDEPTACASNGVGVLCFPDITQPTCTRDGHFSVSGVGVEHGDPLPWVRYYSVDECHICGEVHDFDLPASHTYETQSVTYPTCESDGIIIRKCSDCGEIEEEVLEKTSHSYHFKWVNKGDRIGSLIGPQAENSAFILECTDCKHTLFNNEYPEPSEETTTVAPVETSTETVATTTEPATGESVTSNQEVTTTTTVAPTTTTKQVTTTTTQKPTTTKPVVTATNLKKVSIKKAINKKSLKIVVSWKKVNNAKKYKIQYSTDKRFKKNVKTKTTKNLTYTIKKLKRKKTYYIRVRGVSGANLGVWSKKKTITVKK